MNESLAKRVKAAAGAGWCTLIIGAVWLTASWCAFLLFMRYQPGWVRTLWGGDAVTWEYYQRMALPFFGVFKLILFAIAMASIWLSLWTRKLRKA